MRPQVRSIPSVPHKLLIATDAKRLHLM